MNNRLTNFMWMIMPFLVAGNLFPMITFSQSQKIAQSNNKSIVPQKNLETLRAIYEGNELNAKSFNANWLPDGSGFTVLENEPGLSQRVLASYDAASGKRTVLFNPNDLILSGLGKEIFSIQNYQFSNGGKCILIQLNGQNEKSKNSGYWMLDLKTGKIQKVIAGRNNIISPDGQKVLFTKDGNLQVYNLKSDSTVALTNDAVNGSVSNGQSVWSPDGKKLLLYKRMNPG